MITRDMIKKIKEIRKDLDPAQQFANMNDSVRDFAQSLSRVVGDKYPEVFTMTEEEYVDVRQEVEDFVKSKEGVDLNTKFQLESLSKLLLDTVLTMFLITDGNKKDIINALNQEVASRLGVNDVEKI